VRFLGISVSGTEALTPEALGRSVSTRETICDEMYCWIPTTPPKRTVIVAVKASTLIFIRVTLSGIEKYLSLKNNNPSRRSIRMDA
jgi:hypothetical protein